MRTFILGPSYRASQDWFSANWEERKLTVKGTTILYDEHALRGMNEFHVIYLPQWYMNRHADAIQRAINHADARPGSRVSTERIK